MAAVCSPHRESEDIIMLALDDKQKDFVTLCLHHPMWKTKFKYHTYKSSETILSIGAPITHFGIVVEGILKAENYTRDGNELCGAYFEYHDVFPEFLYFNGERNYAYSLVCAKRTEVAWLPVKDFEDMIETDADIMYAFMLYLSRRGLKNQLLLNCLNYQTIRERIAFWLLGMSSLANKEILLLPCSQTMWANMLRVSRSSLNQELKHMEQEGCFQRDGRHLIILDKQRLEDIL